MSPQPLPHRRGRRKEHTLSMQTAPAARVKKGGAVAAHPEICHAFAMLLPCNALAALWPCSCHALAMLLPCSCHALCAPVAVAMLLPCSCPALALFWPCSCRAFAMLLPCSCQSLAALLPLSCCICHALAVLLQCSCHVLAMLICASHSNSRCLSGVTQRVMCSPPHCCAGARWNRPRVAVRRGLHCEFRPRRFAGAHTRRCSPRVAFCL